MEIENEQIYPEKVVKDWLISHGDVQPNSRRLRKILRNGEQIEIGDDVYFFISKDGRQYKAHKGNAKNVREIFALLDKATQAPKRLHAITLIAIALIVIWMATVAVTLITRQNT